MLFNDLFRDAFRTELVGGGDEPEYLPAAGTAAPARVVFTRDYYASALHEVSHWCIAGRRRRGLTDYGYWYAPDGRSAPEQADFEKVEVRPQALESLFSAAAGFRFHVSLDNLSGDGTADEKRFRDRVESQALVYLNSGMPARAVTFAQALLSFYRQREAFVRHWGQAAHAFFARHPIQAPGFSAPADQTRDTHRL